MDKNRSMHFCHISSPLFSGVVGFLKNDVNKKLSTIIIPGMCLDLMISLLIP